MRATNSNRFSLSCTRRQGLIVGGSAALGRSLGLAGDLGHLSIPKGRVRSVLMLYLFGGPGQLDTFDMKPQAPAEIRGELAPIATKVAGLNVCELLPKTATIADRLTVVRTLNHNRTVHGGAVVYALTGELNGDPGIPGVRGPDASLADHPNLGSAIRMLGPVETQIPNAIALPWRMIDGQGREPPGQWAGMIGKNFNPWLIESDPSKPNFRVDSLALPAELPVSRLSDRQALLSVIDRHSKTLDDLAVKGHVDTLYRQASMLLSSQTLRRAFDLGAEAKGLRDRYGRNTFGQSCLLARRLVEVGAPFVQVNMGPSLFGDYGWDTHSNTFPSMRKNLCPKFDPAFATLIADLDERGLLDSTLVVVNSEFGRSPKIQRNGGRDHWPFCYSLLFAGGGVRRGAIVGQSDSRAAYPVTKSFSPADVAATVYDALGIDPATEIRDSQNRPVRLNRGEPIRELFG